MNKFQFNPPTGLLDTSAYPTNPNTEAEARGQVQAGMNQIRDYINSVIYENVATQKKFPLALSSSVVQIPEYSNYICLSGNNIVTISIGVRYRIADSNGLTHNITLMTLPSEVRPSKAMSIPSAFIYRMGSHGNAIGYLYIDSSGKISVNLMGDMTAFNQVNFTISYVKE